MPKSYPPYPPEFRRRMVELVRAGREPFRLGHIMEVIGIEAEEDDRSGVIVRVKEGKKTGYVPLCDLEVTSREGRNCWPVREYVVWDANR